MKAFIWLALAGLLTSTALAAVSVQVYRADEQTPLAWADPNTPDAYQDIMVETRLTLFVVSDTATSTWGGGLWVSWDDWSRGILAGRGYDENTWNYDGSILPACSEDTFICDVLDENGMTFSLNIDGMSAAGEWFVLDYYAEALGTCHVGVFSYEMTDGVPYAPPDGLYNLPEPPPWGAVWTQNLAFNHVPSRDYNRDSTVNFVDFALWADQWQATVIPDPNAPAPSDLNADNFVGVSDLALFCDFWLERTDILEPSSEPNDPNITLPDGTETGIL